MKKLRTVLLTLLGLGMLTWLIGQGIGRRADTTVSDLLYQRPSATDGDIVIVGIDQEALDTYGPYQTWGRSRIADVLETLNVSEDDRPAVIGLDILFSGAGTDPASDSRLAATAGQYGNVITASFATFETALTVSPDGGYRLDDFSIAAFEEPYEALAAVTKQGHINAMLDVDGVLRHHLLTLDVQGEQVPSLALAAAEQYAEEIGLDPIEVPPVDGHGFWYLSFSETPGGFEEISIAEVLSGAVPPDFFAGKIVLIGPYAPGLQDNCVTAIDHAQTMYGVEVQANAIQALLWGEYRSSVSEGIQYVVLFGLLLAGLWIFRQRRVWISTAVWVLSCMGWLLLCRTLGEAGWLLHVLWIPLGLTVLYGGSLGVNTIRATLERQRITNMFQRYVAPEIVQEILAEGSAALELGGKLVRVAVLFVDIRGFTTMSEQLTPPQVVEILNRYLTLTSDCILKNGGTLDKFVGDATMAFWGAPLPQEDYVLKAVRAAMDMVEGSRALSEELMERYGRTVSFGIGVHVGDAVIGNIGSPRRMDYTAIGDTVNTAARLEANAPGGTVYISRAVADALAGRIRATPLAEPLRLKGKKDGFEVLSVEEILS